MIEEQLFNQALEYPSDERSGFLASQCGDDLVLRNRIELLLHAHENPESFLQEKPGTADHTTVVYDRALGGPKLAEPYQTYDPGMIELNLTRVSRSDNRTVQDSSANWPRRVWYGLHGRAKSPREAQGGTEDSQG